MAHLALKPGNASYARLAARLNRFPQGAPPSELLFRILKLLLSEREAGLVAQLPIRPFTAKRAAELWKVPESEARKVLDGLASRAVLLDIEQGGATRYLLPPPMAGFFEFSLMRVRGDLDQKALSELFYQYLNVEEAFVRDLFATGQTQLGRVFVDETALPKGLVPKPPRAALGAPGGVPQGRRDERSGSTRIERGGLPPDAVEGRPPPQPEGTTPGGRSAVSTPLNDEPHRPAGVSFSVSPGAIRETKRNMQSIPPDDVAAHGGFGTSPEVLTVLDYERASAVVQGAKDIGVGTCYCRHKMSHLGRACDAPMDICMTFGNCAASLTRHGVARKVAASEALELLDQARDRGLVQFGENVREDVGFICNCCGCCCEALIAARRFGFMKPVHTTNFLPALDGEACNGCGKCVSACPVEALSLVSAHSPARPSAKTARLDEAHCLGCGVCVRACPKGAIRLRSRPQRVLTPATTVHRTVLMAIERGKLAELLVDGQSAYGYRALAAILGALLKLPPLKQALASRQVKSRYLERWLPVRGTS